MPRLRRDEPIGVIVMPSAQRAQEEDVLRRQAKVPAEVLGPVLAAARADVERLTDALAAAKDAEQAAEEAVRAASKAWFRASFEPLGERATTTWVRPAPDDPNATKPEPMQIRRGSARYGRLRPDADHSEVREAAERLKQARALHLGYLSDLQKARLRLRSLEQGIWPRELETHEVIPALPRVVRQRINRDIRADAPVSGEQLHARQERQAKKKGGKP